MSASALLRDFDSVRLLVMLFIALCSFPALLWSTLRAGFQLIFASHSTTAVVGDAKPNTAAAAAASDDASSLSSSLVSSLSMWWILWLCYFALGWSLYGHMARYLIQYISVKRAISRFVKTQSTAADMFERRVRATPNAVGLMFGETSYTFAAMNGHANRVTNWGLNVEQLPRSSCVAIMMENRPHFIFVWLGLAKIGVSSALINTNIRGSGLLHSIRVCNATCLVVGVEHVDAVRAIRSELPPTLKLYSFGSAQPIPGFDHLDTELARASDQPSSSSALAIRRAGLTSSDLLFYIFTSGTTGLPKAAHIKHSRFMMAGASFSHFHGVTNADRIYCPLPIYHSAGGMLGVSLSWYSGATLVLRNKFSASSFFRDCQLYGCTVVLYIGQLCQYLLNTPRSASDRTHPVQKALGNGLRKEIWSEFRTRFGIPYVGEFYGSTEGNATLVNNQNVVGAVGFIPPIAKLIYPIAFVRFDYVNEIPIRDPATGHCIECRVGETGELLSLINPSDPMKSFDGYTDSKATNSKIVSDVFKSGDRWFRSGDLLVCDAKGFVFFVDRIGDTFRWKGENVSTNEVTEVIAAFKGIKEVNVYGVSVPSYDGKAGMASIVLESAPPPAEDGTDQKSPVFSVNVGSAASVQPVDVSGFDFDAFYRQMRSHLANYQQPLFLRFTHAMPITTTFKHRKIELVRDGFNPHTIRASAPADRLYWRDDRSAADATAMHHVVPIAPAAATATVASGRKSAPPGAVVGGRGFVSLDSAAYDAIINGQLRL